MITFAGVAAAALIDFRVTGRTIEMDLYRNGLDFDAPAPRRLGQGQTLRLQCVGAVASAAVALAASTLDADTGTQQLAAMSALLVGGSVATCCGFRIGVNSTDTPRDLLERFESMPDLLFVINFLPRRISRLAGVFARIALGLILLLPFAAIVGRLHETALNVPIVLVALGLGAFFQLGFAILAQALFALRWRRSGLERVAK